MERKNIDLIIIVFIAVMNIVLALLPFHLPLAGSILALPLVFVLPGYILTEMLFQKRVQDIVHRILFSLGLSLAIDILAGFLLNVFPTGLRGIPWALLLGLFTILFSLWVAYLRRKTVLTSSNLKRVKVSPFELLLIGLSLIGITFSISYSAASVIQEPHQYFTQLWMLPSAQPGNSCAMSIGIKSFESASTTYKLVMTVNNVPAHTWSPITLLPAQQWNQLVLTVPKTGENTYVEAKLYRGDEPNVVYRDVHLTIQHVTKNTNGQKNACTT
jgi:uncharacterized membrane protein